MKGLIIAAVFSSITAAALAQTLPGFRPSGLFDEQ